MNEIERLNKALEFKSEEISAQTRQIISSSATNQDKVNGNSGKSSGEQTSDKKDERNDRIQQLESQNIVLTNELNRLN